VTFSLAIVGEAPGKEEVFSGLPFVGPAGQELARMAQIAGLPTRIRTVNQKYEVLDLDRDQLFITNVFSTRPPDNDLKHYSVTLAEARELYPHWRAVLSERFPDFPFPGNYAFPPIAPSRYIHPERLHVLPRLRDELSRAAPNLVVALGNTACWAVLRSVGVGQLRGVVRLGEAGVWPGKVLPTYHPSAILRQWSLRSITIADLGKAYREGETGDLAPEVYSLVVEPTWEELVECAETLGGVGGNGGVLPPISVDIETRRGQITHIGFGWKQDLYSAICIPLLRLDGTLYWGDRTREVLEIIYWILQLPNPKVFQNGLYDLQYIWRTWGMTVKNVEDDTLLMHHTLQPEMPKSLKFLASVYTRASDWKGLNKLAKFKNSEEKRDA
jgi:uracil-DNA glycosylase